MPTFTVPTWKQPIDNRLGDFGVSFPVSFQVMIDTDDVVTPYPGADGLTFDGAKSGSGDNGLAVFRQGRTYTITAGEQTLLEAAGYGDHIEE